MSVVALMVYVCSFECFIREVSPALGPFDQRKKMPAVVVYSSSGVGTKKRRLFKCWDPSQGVQTK